MQTRPFATPTDAATLWRIRRLTAQLDHWRDTIVSDLDAKRYNPNQPRVPRGSSDGGQWTDSGGGGATGGSGRFDTGRPGANPLLKPAMTRKPPHTRKPGEELLEGGGPRGGGAYGGRSTFRAPSTPKSPEANAAVPKIQRLDRRGADDLHEAVQSRAQGHRSPKETNPHIREAADDIEKFLGGKIDPKDIKPTKSGDLVILKGDKKFRMDVKDPGKLKDGKTSDEPHFHFQRLDQNNRWVDASDTHRNYFKKD